MTEATRIPEVGDVLHVLGPSIPWPIRRGVIGVCETRRRGDTLFVTDIVVEYFSQGGDNIFQHVGEEGAQLGWGAWPQGERASLPGSPERLAERHAAREVAWKIADPAERARRLREIDETIAPAPKTSKTLAKYGAQKSTFNRERQDGGVSE
ncbi:hypothetical protein GCM10010988_17460 [Cnuibacter physcomitrellae]|uniref:hypothetical protein n=1 Tax=Cnuibacter physcomitrellae TaxID=1619308 RepID=UPI0012F4F20B|nr:hypothetical protein [Cnuibacter physcomitrellae]GGI38131.1 hypothetical protein GCM10010988_17460 [Cnuibacter physcomitrellae]